MRAAIGVLALYAVLLQAFLGAAAPRALDSGLAALCLVHADDSSSPAAPLHADHQCCIAAAPAALPPPPFAGQLSGAPRAAALLVVWTPESDLPRTGPPRSSHSPRGPPTA